jgi:hypothetical protein
MPFASSALLNFPKQRESPHAVNVGELANKPSKWTSRYFYYRADPFSIAFVEVGLERYELRF